MSLVSHRNLSRSSGDVSHSVIVSARLSLGKDSADRLATMKLKIQKLREQHGWTQADLAEVSGLSRSYIAGIESKNVGKSPSMEAFLKLAKAFNVRIGELFDDAKPVVILGKVGSGARVILFDERAKSGGPYNVSCPFGLPGDGSTVGIEVEGDSMAPVYKDGDVLFYSYDTSGVSTEAAGNICVCEDVAGNSWVKYIKSGSEPGKFHLISLNPIADNVFDVQLKWAAPVVLLWPQGMVERV